ncbi:MAG: glycosyltransferase family 4 protein [Candidatus Woykebacteria bacterium]
MKLLFVHDHYFSSDGRNVYSDKFPGYVFKRYLRVFDHIDVWGRVTKERDNYKNLPLASIDGSTFHFGRSISGLNSFFGTRKRECNRLSSLIKNADCVIARLPSEYGLMAVKLAEKMNKPYGTEVVGCAWDALWNYGSLKGKLYAPILYKRMQTAVAQSDYTVYVSNHFLQQRYPPKKDSVTSNISNVEIEDVPDKIIKQRLNQIENTSSKITFGTIGSLKTRYKGVHIAIKALSKGRENLDFEYRVLGSGDSSFYEGLANESEIADKVIFDGTLPSGGPVFDWLDSIDIYLHPSFQEGLPRAVIEAMSRGCPVIGSSTGGIPELIDHNYIHKPGDEDELAKLILKLANDKELMKRKAIENFEESKNYCKEILDQKRHKFLTKLAESIEK